MFTSDNGGELSVPNDLAVNSAGDAVLELQVHLGDGVLGEDGSIRDITCRSKNVSRIPHHPNRTSKV